ncbi:MAG: hypothetical protein U0800_11190 [Isosphaeraceae bacterium]
MLMAVGVLGVVLPGVVGMPALVAGGLALWPRAARVETWLERRTPKPTTSAWPQIGRFPWTTRALQLRPR